MIKRPLYIYIYIYKYIKGRSTYMYMVEHVQPGNQSDEEIVPKGQPKPLWFHPEGKHNAKQMRFIA
jgi:hypothetical protein